MKNLKEIVLKEVSDHEKGKVVEVNINLLNDSKPTSYSLEEDAHKVLKENYGSRYISSRLKYPIITFDSNSNSVMKAKLELIVELEHQTPIPQLEIKENLIKDIRVFTKSSRLVEELILGGTHLIQGDAPGIDFVPELFDQEVKKIYGERYIDAQVRNLKAEDIGNGFKAVSFEYILHLNPEIKIGDQNGENTRQ